MIISQTPYRMSFAGGGTDLPAFYLEEPGAVLSTAIDRHIYVTIGTRFDQTIRVAYSITEVVDSRDALKHGIVREAMKMLGLEDSLEITTIGDVPAGTGLGSSSALAVGLLNAMSAYQGRSLGAEELARGACEIELEKLGSPIGKQDQYSSAYGGLQYMQFNPDGSVHVEPVPVSAQLLSELEDHLLIFYTGQTRDANAILTKQSQTTEDKRLVLRRMRDLAGEMRDALAGPQGGNLDTFGELLHEGWQLKRSVVGGITTDIVDDWYTRARKVGAKGGKLLGAGGGGFLLLLADPDLHDEIRDELGHPKELPAKLDPRGSRIIFIGNRP